MMFGQTAAVYAFLRFSRALAALAAECFGLLLVEFFDDFTQVEASALGDSAQMAFESMVDVLGWKLAVTPERKAGLWKKNCFSWSPHRFGGVRGGTNKLEEQTRTH